MAPATWRASAFALACLLTGCAQNPDGRFAPPALAPVEEPVIESAAPTPKPARAQQSPGRMFGRWKQDDDEDPVSGQRTTMFSNQAVSTFVQFGAPVTANLFLFCDAKSHRLRAAIYFSEEVGVDPSVPEDPILREVNLPEPTRGQFIRYRFDSQVPTGPIPLEFRAHGQQADIPPELTARILAASHLRLELQLPWAEDVSLEFDNAGAAEARRNLPC
jgi:hypothetical protein